MSKTLKQLKEEVALLQTTQKKSMKINSMLDEVERQITYFLSEKQKADEKYERDIRFSEDEKKRADEKYLRDIKIAEDKRDSYIQYCDQALTRLKKKEQDVKREEEQNKKILDTILDPK